MTGRDNLNARESRSSILGSKSEKFLRMMGAGGNKKKNKESVKVEKCGEDSAVVSRQLEQEFERARERNMYSRRGGLG